MCTFSSNLTLKGLWFFFGSCFYLGGWGNATGRPFRITHFLSFSVNGVASISGFKLIMGGVNDRQWCLIPKSEVKRRLGWEEKKEGAKYDAHFLIMCTGQYQPIGLNLWWKLPQAKKMVFPFAQQLYDLTSNNKSQHWFLIRQQFSTEIYTDGLKLA